MEIKTYEQRVLIPDEGKWLYNEKAQVITDKVFLGVNSKVENWIEITEEEKQEIEQKNAVN